MSFLQSLQSGHDNRALESNQSIDDVLKALEKWEQLVANEPADNKPSEYTSFDDEPPPPSILDALAPQHVAPAAESSALLNALINLDHAETVMPVLVELLASTKSSDEISSELLELVGFDHFDLVSSLLEHRKDMSHLLSSQSTFVQVEHNSHAGPTSRKNLPSSAEEAKRNINASLAAAANRPLFSSDAASYAPEALPHIYTVTSHGYGGLLSATGQKYVLPVDTTRVENETFTEVTIPPAKTVPPRAHERLITIADMDELCRGSFPGYKSLNRVQSIIYPTVYRTNENMLVCAPTGAGKTDVAMLAVLRTISQFLRQPTENIPLAARIRRDDFKIIYVAPMKALAAEIVRKLGKRLERLNVLVRELTGDMQLTQAEIAQTQIIVTTPEKWDVVTRKPTGEGELASKVKLLIIDEVHLLNEERGAVIETIVARTLRQVESTQSLIRVVGLSATLPNYRDVAEFLGVSPYNGLFFFDSSFRPVPLEQHFVGIKGKPGSTISKKNLEAVTFEKISELIREGHQTAQSLKEMGQEDGNLDDFSCQGVDGWYSAQRDVSSSRNRELRELFAHGFGIHHAGMLRADRNLTERLFSSKQIKVLVCTATLAWGVNLPAHAVVIKGTQVYDTSRGKFVDLSVLDVLQIFGRAGRPGLESSGEGYILTTDDRLTHYLEAVTSQHPIESRFETGLIDSLNAEISLGTVSSVSEGMQWLSYTYLFVRMRRNPMVYGMSHDEPVNDPTLSQKRTHLITTAARHLVQARMITFDESTGRFEITDLGRIAARYYIRHTSVEIFNQQLRPVMTEADILAVVSMSTEVKIVPCEVKGGTETKQGKTNILLQGYISQAYMEDFALVSDMAYVAQNGARILRALLDIALSRKWATVCAVLMALSKAVEKRMWPYENPLKQQTELHRDVLYNLERFADDSTPVELVTKSAAELGELLRMNEQHGAALLRAAQHFPAVAIEYVLRPLTSDVLRIAVMVTPAFEWSNKHHGSLEPWWVWLEDERGVEIFQWFNVPLRSTSKAVEINFAISIRDGNPPKLARLHVPLAGLRLPLPFLDRSPLLELPFLPVSAVRHPAIRGHLSHIFQSFNAIQTQAFWSIHRSNTNALLSAPTACGKTTLVLSAMCIALAEQSGGIALVVCPTRHAAKESLFILRRLCKAVGAAVEPAFTPDTLKQRRGPGSKVFVVTAACLAAALPFRAADWQDLRSVVCDDLHLLDAQYEMAVSFLMHATQNRPVRFLGIADSLDDPSGLADWLRVDRQSLHCFRPTDRDQALAINTRTFNIPFSAALFKAMAKPLFNAIMARPPDSTTLVFVPSRYHCVVVGSDLITQCASQLNTRGFLGQNTTREAVQPYAERLADRALVELLLSGIGVFHEGVSKSDQTLILQLYLEGVVRVLIAPREACWSVPVRASTVVAMGTQYTRVRDGGDRQVVDYGPQEVVRMLGKAIAHGQPGHFHLFCPAESLDTFMRFINQGLTLESRVQESDLVRNWLNAARGDGSIAGKQDAMDALSFTYLAKRLQINPAYYDSSEIERDDALSRILDNFWTADHS
ncbi:Sec63-domain-containing protein [Auriculariales sp. MPI-PUGE-AT-0066]|nr:Sec63-domain-containing protein [Auriculariales sp. MPI-PUGE-AT-0066]